MLASSAEFKRLEFWGGPWGCQSNSRGGLCRLWPNPRSHQWDRLIRDPSWWEILSVWPPVADQSCNVQTTTTSRFPITRQKVVLCQQCSDLVTLLFPHCKSRVIRSAYAKTISSVNQSPPGFNCITYPFLLLLYLALTKLSTNFAEVPYKNIKYRDRNKSSQLLLFFNHDAFSQLSKPLSNHRRKSSTTSQFYLLFM